MEKVQPKDFDQTEWCQICTRVYKALWFDDEDTAMEILEEHGFNRADTES